MTPKEVLIAGRLRIQSESAWTRNKYARNALGAAVASTHPNACMFCCLGAIDHELTWSEDRADAASCLLKAVRKLHKNKPAVYGVPEFNDDPATTHDDVLRVFDLAIDLAREAEEAAKEKQDGAV